ncbi:MAG: hypothetical protein JXA11_16065 [Phycisphaerae bacterium]|nr:hypothetical protein [Phycisphaerae bacterium]
MNRHRLFLLLIWAAWLAGCDENRMRSGVVVSSEPPPLLHYRDFSPRVFVESDEGGKSIRLDKVGGPFYVVGFVEPPGDDAGYLNPVLTEMALKLWLDSIEVIQITLPTKDCPLTEPQRQAVSPNVLETKNNFARFFDPHKIAWEAFYHPKPGAILVVDRCTIIPMIDTRSTLADPRRILDRVEHLQRQWEDDMYQWNNTLP